LFSGFKVIGRSRCQPDPHMAAEASLLQGRKIVPGPVASAWIENARNLDPPSACIWCLAGAILLSHSKRWLLVNLA
jgi:hypothetical protein